MGGLQIPEELKKLWLTKEVEIKERVEKCFSCFRDVRFGVTGQRRHVPAVQPVTVNYGSIVLPPPSPHFPLVSLLSSSSLLQPQLLQLLFLFCLSLVFNPPPWLL